MPLPLIALALAAAQPAAPAPGASVVHTFAGLTMAPAGDRLAVIEADRRDDAASEPHRQLVLRSAATGAASPPLRSVSAIGHRCSLAW